MEITQEDLELFCTVGLPETVVKFKTFRWGWCSDWCRLKNLNPNDSYNWDLANKSFKSYFNFKLEQRAIERAERKENRKLNSIQLAFIRGMIPFATYDLIAYYERK